MADPVAILPALREKTLISRGNVSFQSRIALVNHQFGIDLADPVGSGILTVGSGMAGEFGGTPASLSISHDDVLNPARCLSKQQPRDPQFERTTAGALSPSLAKVHPFASTSAIQPPPFRELMSNKQR